MNNNSLEALYAYLVKYFDNPVLEKDRDSDNPSIGPNGSGYSIGYSIYMCQVHAQLALEKRYLVVLVPRDVVFVGETRRLSQLKWVSFQARTLVGVGKSFPVLRYAHRQFPENNSVIQREAREVGTTVYTCADYPIRISMLDHVGQMFDYPERATLRTALETYHTVVYRVG
jgi:hypothetical protein